MKLQIMWNGRCKLSGCLKKEDIQEILRTWSTPWGRINVHHNLNDEREELPKSPHEKDYVMRFTRANGLVTKLVKIF